MFTQCRGCGEIFKLQADDLVIAKGRVRCNVCGTVFEALETLSDQAPQEDEDLFLHQSESAPPLLTRAMHWQEPESIPEFVDQDTVNDAPLLEPMSKSSEPLVSQLEEASEVVNEASTSINSIHANIDIENELVAADVQTDAQEQTLSGTDVPIFLDPTDHFEPLESTTVGTPHSEEVSNQQSSKMWLALSAVAFVLLAWQTVAAIKTGAIKLPEGGFSSSVCEALSCQEIAEPINLQAVSLVSRTIRQHPGRDQALIISASMTNGDETNKRFPAIEIILSDLNGDAMAMRRFLPQEYLSEEILKAGFVSDLLIPVSLEVKSPGQKAVAFEIDFVQP